MQLSANNRTVLITGGSQGLGLATAKAYMQAGANVAIVARRAQPLKEAADMLAQLGEGKIAAITCDVSSVADLERAHAEAVDTLGPIDILVNNAGKSQTDGFETISDEVWQADLDLKLFAAVRMTRLVWPSMRAKRWGRVINVLNVYAKAPIGGSAPTSVSRAAGLALTKVLAGEGAPHNILVNALLVGSIESEQIKRRHARNRPDQSYADYVKEFAANIPLKRIGKPEEFGGTALFLGSDAAGYITGAAINIDGGMCPVV
jgi:NAD(P)-dependent dehydrogenase (short-subunit alcohol dehydrogenase family)